MTTTKDKASAMQVEATALFKAAPRVMKAFQDLMGAASQAGALSSKHKELMALAIAVHAHCEGCMMFHIEGASRHGATREEVVEALCVAIEMGGGPATYYGGRALAMFDDFASAAR